MITKSRLLRFGTQLITEVAVIAIASLIVIFGLRAAGYFRPKPNFARVDHTTRLSVGSRLKIKTVDFRGHPLSMVLITSPTCPYCLASQSFHRTLTAQSQQYNMPFYVAVPSRSQASAYTRSTAFPESAIREWGDLDLSAEGTPTIIAVNQDGIIRRVWLGRLSPALESDVLKTIQSRSISESASSTLQDIQNYPSADLDKLKAGNKVTIIETRERDAPGIRADAIIMPGMELPFRAPFELKKDHLQIVDCSNLLQERCESSVHALSEAGYRVATLDAGAFAQSCEITKTQ